MQHLCTLQHEHYTPLLASIAALISSLPVVCVRFCVEGGQMYMTQSEGGSHQPSRAVKETGSMQMKSILKVVIARW